MVFEVSLDAKVTKWSIEILVVHFEVDFNCLGMQEFKKCQIEGVLK